jgi:hypothetical protein
MNTRLTIAALATAATATASAQVDRLDPEQLQFFEKRIRPVLVENCYKCHSATAEKIKGSLLIDTKEGVLKGGATGPAVVPGKPEKSLLVKAIKSTNEDEMMPPKGDRLPPEVIADFELWIRSGAPDPRVAVAGAKSALQVDMEKAKKHWAYQPVTAPPVPKVKDSRKWARTDLDKFVLAKLESKNLEPSPMADRRTLLRRATFDLIGLPPTAQEVADFIADKSPNAFEKVLDRLLASKHYGERWGRHWLDVARFADTTGDRIGGARRDPKFPYAWTYRDYVINAFNDDKPYDRFIVEQLAADRLELGDNKMPLAAMGFLTVGKRFMGNINEVIDDRIDVVTQGLMGMTAACARCHDHKFDPIPQKDYYSLHGVFNSSQEPDEEPMLFPPADNAAFADFNKKVEEIGAVIAGIRGNEEGRVLTGFRSTVDKYLLGVRDVQVLGNKDAQVRNTRGLDPDIFTQWKDYLANVAKKSDPVFAPWFAFASLKDEEFNNRAKELAEKFATGSCDGKAINPLVAKLFTTTPKSADELAEAYAKLFKDVDKDWQAAQKADAKSLESPKEELRLVLYGSGTPITLDRRGFQRIIGNRIQNAENAERSKISDLKMTHPGSPVRAMALTDKPRAVDSFVMIRGEPANRGPVVPRQFLEILSKDKREPFKNGSGRLDLAQHVASKDNPLTARVFVNRVWQWHFGDAIVRTLGDFGLRSDPPSNQELLDYLAVRFMADGWSIKKLHKTIMLSAVWMQSSKDNAKNSAIDPGNSLFWKQNLQRLDFESLRDTLLVLGGKSEFDRIGGPSVELTGAGEHRRTLYGHLDRARIPDSYRIFDFANPDMTAPQRLLTTVPLQALFMMNNGFVIEQAKHITARPEMISGSRDEEKVGYLYSLIHQRAPTAGETKLALAYLADQQGKPATGGSDVAAWRYGSGEYDAKAKKLKSFEPMPMFLRDSWVVADKEQMRKLTIEQAKQRPAPKKGNPNNPNVQQNLARQSAMGTAFGISLNAVGGNPGDEKHSVIRRWVSPVDGEVSIEGALIHKAKTGEGVLGVIHTSRAGELGRWVADGSETETRIERITVKKGDTIDFITSNRGPTTPNSDDDEAFTWAPIIHLLNAKKGEHSEWNAQQEFSGPVRPAATSPIAAKGMAGKNAPNSARVMTREEFSAWERLTQAMLLSNELIYVN